METEDEKDEVYEYLIEKKGEPQVLGTALPIPNALNHFYYYKEEGEQLYWLFASDGFLPHGFELTLRVLRAAKEENPPNWPYRLFGDYFNYISSSGSRFIENDFMQYTDGPLDADVANEFIGSVFVLDDELTYLPDPEKKIPFLQVFPLTERELQEVMGTDEEAKEFIEQLREKVSKKLVIDLARKPIV